MLTPLAPAVALYPAAVDRREEREERDASVMASSADAILRGIGAGSCWCEFGWYSATSAGGVWWCRWVCWGSAGSDDSDRVERVGPDDAEVDEEVDEKDEVDEKGRDVVEP